MKKFFSLIAAVLFAGSLMAGEVTLDYSKKGYANQQTLDGVAVNQDGVIFTLAKGSGSTKPAYYTTGTGARTYGGNTLTIDAGTNTIKTVTFEFTQNNKNYTVDSGTYTKANAKWEGSANSVVFTAETGTGHNRIKSITVTVDGVIVLSPKIEPEDSSFPGSVEVSIKAEDGLKVYYTLNETDPTVESTEYTAPFTLTETTLVKAIAVNGDVASSIVEKKYIKADTLTVAEAVELATALADNTESNKNFVEGFAVYVAAYSQQYSNQDFFLVADTLAPDSVLMVYRATPMKDDAAYPVYKGDKVRVYGSLKKYKKDNNTPVQLEVMFPTVEFLEEVERPAEPIILDTITVAEALELGAPLAHQEYTEKEYVVEGYVIKAESFYMPNKNQSWLMTDDASASDSKFKAYRCVPVKGDDTIQVLNGDKVRLLGKLQKYVQGTDTLIEISNAKAEFISMIDGDHTPGAPIQSKIDTITVERALAIGEALADMGVTDSLYVIEGYVSNIVNYFSEETKKETFWITSEKGKRVNTNADGAFEVYGGVPTPAAEIGYDARVYVTAKIKKYVSKTATVIETDGDPTVNVVEPGIIEVIPEKTVAEAIAIGQALNTGAVTTERYDITGYVSQIDELYDDSYKNETFWISDTKGVRVEGSTNGAFYVFRGKPNTKKEIGLDAKVRIVTTIKNYSSDKIENDVSIDVEVLEQGAIEADTIGVKEALAMDGSFSGKSEKFYVVEGYIASIKQEYDASNGNMSFYMHYKFDKTRGDFQCYRAKVAKKDTAQFKQGSFVRVLGRLEKSGSYAIQMPQGSRAYPAPAPKIDTTFVSVEEAVAIGQGLEDGQETDVYYAVSGYFAYSDVEYDEDAGTQTFGISDDEEFDPEESLSLQALNAVIAAPGADYGEKVYVLGWISKYIDEEEDVIIRIENGNAYVNEIPKPTGFEQIVLTEKARKVLINGGIYIIRDKKMYNLQGARVK